MDQHSISDGEIDRARIDGGFGFALAAFILGLGSLALLQRIGLPEELLRIGAIGLIFSGLLVIAIALRTMRPIDFYAGGRRLPGSYAGIAFAGLVFGLFLPFLPPLPRGVGFLSLLAGFGIGCLWALFATGPILRRNGAYSLADLIGSRFPHILIRGPSVLLMSFCAACVALGGYEVALRGLADATGLDRVAGASLLGGLLILLLVPAGLASAVWIAAAAAVVLVMTLSLPLGIDLLSGIPLALPALGDQTLWADVVAHFSALTGASSPPPLQPPLILAVAIGFATLAPIFGAPLATRSEGAAWRCGLIGALWLAFGALLIAATIAASTLALEAQVSGIRATALPPPVLAASGRGDIGICGFYASDPAALAQACAAVKGSDQPLRMHDLEADGSTLLESLPALRGSEPTFARLAAIFMIVLGIATAAAGLQFLVTALGHDILHPSRRHLAPVSQRLAITRLLMIVSVILASLWLARRGAEVQTLLMLALMGSAALVAPLFALALMPWPGTASAFAALCVGAFVTGHFLLSGGAVAPAGQLATNALFAAFDALAVGLFVTFLPKQKSQA